MKINSVVLIELKLIAGMSKIHVDVQICLSFDNLISNAYLKNMHAKDKLRFVKLKALSKHEFYRKINKLALYDNLL